MTLARWQSTITDGQGNVIPEAFIEVRRESNLSVLAPIKSDREGAASLGNPFNADADGFAAFHALGGAYYIRAYKVIGGELFEKIWRYEAIGLAAETDLEVGISGGLNMAFDDGTSDADPGAGLLRFNHATPASVTFIYADLADSFGSDITAWLEALDDSGTSSDRGRLRIQVDGNAAVWREYTVSGAVVTASGYRKIPVTLISSAGTISDGDPLAMFFTPSGPASAITPFNISGGGDGTEGPYTLPAAPTGIEKLLVFVGGVGQRHTTDFTVAADELTFSSSVPSTVPIFGLIFA